MPDTTRDNGLQDGAGCFWRGYFRIEILSIDLARAPSIKLLSSARTMKLIMSGGKVFWRGKKSTKSRILTERRIGL